MYRISILISQDNVIGFSLINIGKPRPNILFYSTIKTVSSPISEHHRELMRSVSAN